MFDFESFEELELTSSALEQLDILSAEQCAVLLTSESLADMCRPVTRLSTNVRIAIQQEFNRTVALMIKDADASESESLQELVKQAVMRVKAAQQTGDDTVLAEAVEKLERATNFFGDLAANVTRNSYYRFEEASKQEKPAADSNVVGIDGAVGAFETRSKYAGWRAKIVESDTLILAASIAVKGLLTCTTVMLPFASAYLQGLMIATHKVDLNPVNASSVEDLYEVYRDCARASNQKLEGYSPKLDAESKRALRAATLEFVDKIVEGEVVAIGFPAFKLEDSSIESVSFRKPVVQLGYRKEPETKDGQVEYTRFYDVRDVWQDIVANRKVVAAPMSAKDAAAGFNL